MKNKFIVKIEVIAMLIIDRMFLFNREVSYNLKEKIIPMSVILSKKEVSYIIVTYFFFKLQI